MKDAAELKWGRYSPGQQSPIGSYWNIRTMCIFQQIADGALPQVGDFHLVDNSGTQTLANIATTINAYLNTTYVAASFHLETGADVESPLPGQGANDA